MPYIAQEKRDVLDPMIEALLAKLAELEIDDDENNMEGNINYTFTRLLMMVYGDKNSTRYSNVNDAMGILASVQAEYYRKVAAPYEDQKEFENGEVSTDIDHEPLIVPPVIVDEAAVKAYNKFVEDNPTFNADD
jgi:hypothetical protein